MTETTRGSIEMTIAMTLMGTIGWFVVMSGQPAIDVVFWRCLFGALALTVICAGMGLFKGQVTKGQIGLAALGGVAIVLNWLLLFSAFPRASISISTVVYNTQPFMLLVFGAIFFGEKLTIRKIGLLGVAFVGVIAITQNRPDAVYVGTDYLTGILLALGAAFLWAVAAVITKKLTGMRPHLITLIQVSVGVVMLAPFVGFTDLPTDYQSWLMLAGMGVIHTGLLYILMYGAIQKLPTHLQGALSFVYPVSAITIDAIAFGVTLAPIQLSGMAAVLFAAMGMTLGWGAPGLTRANVER
ncbi:DMT family transporter [Roseinatronobacter alkalisoli]|uniref:DMT family transporter n=1 Tax=Roseinatronobacter alkalisoli TaxID=3028235 RepID=A0ABT5T826_9RHOB|nr:DMT family transporter [Roseinatronobacter sp. HJB301]MDD7970850.1 DMT family transporter [Roseinatronobacter sp. HJB301]